MFLVRRQLRGRASGRREQGHLYFDQSKAIGKRQRVRNSRQSVTGEIRGDVLTLQLVMISV
jgi:hypothetical protein